MRFKKISCIGDKVTLTTVYDEPIANYYDNYRLRMENYRKLTKGKTMMPVCSVPVDDLERLIAQGDMDAIAYKYAQNDLDLRRATRNLLAKHPYFRTSEARI